MLKSKHPIFGLSIAIVVLYMLYCFMEQVYIRTKVSSETSEVTPYSNMNRYFPETYLLPFQDKWSSEKSLKGLKDAIYTLSEFLSKKDRVSYLDYLALQLDWREVFSSTEKYIGVLIPAYANKIEESKLESKEGSVWVKVQCAGQSIHVLLKEIPEVSDGQKYYIEIFYLGRVNAEAQPLNIGVARQIHILPNEGVYPQMRSDQDALNEIVDDYEMPIQTRKVSSLAMQHYFGKIQKGEYKKIKVDPNIGYKQLMETPALFRGKAVEFVGRLIFFERRKMSMRKKIPGMGYYYQGYLLDSDRLEYVFRCMELPKSIQINDLVRVRGVFLQRYNFNNRMKKVTWVPLMVTGEVEKVKEKVYGLTHKEKRLILVFLSVLFIIGVLLLFRGNQKKKAYRMRKRGLGKKE